MMNSKKIGVVLYNFYSNKIRTYQEFIEQSVIILHDLRIENNLVL